MSVRCQHCSGELVNDEQSGSPCPHCSKPLIRAITMMAGQGTYKVTGNNVDLVYTSYPEILLSLARDLNARREFSVTVVILQMACEISVERAISKAFSAKKVEFLEDAVNGLLPSRNIANDKVRKVYTSLTGDEIQNQPFWPKLTDLVKWRNAAVHKGKICTDQEASTSLKAAGELVAYLKHA